MQNESWREDEKKILCKIHISSKKCECCKNTMSALFLFNEAKNEVALAKQEERGRILGIIKNMKGKDVGHLGYEETLTEVIENI